MPVGELGRILEAVGWDGAPLSPQAVAALTSRLVARRDAEASSRLRPWERGPNASRPAFPRQYALGRAMFGRLPPIQQVRGPDGTVATDPADIDAVLWDSRKDIWTSPPPMPAQASSLLDIYFRDRPTLAGKVPLPTWHDIATKVVGPSGSAPGAGGSRTRSSTTAPALPPACSARPYTLRPPTQPLLRQCWVPPAISWSGFSRPSALTPRLACARYSSPRLGDVCLGLSLLVLSARS